MYESAIRNAFTRFYGSFRGTTAWGDAGLQVRYDLKERKYHVSDVYIVASTNTDIPNYYGKWLSRQIKAGFIELPSYADPETRIRISLEAKDVKGFVFYSKNYGPFFSVLADLPSKQIKCFFTVGDSNVFKARVPSFDVLIDQARRLVEDYGPENIFWKLPPLFFDSRGRLLYIEELPGLAARMRDIGVNRCLIEIFSSQFHPADIVSRLGSHGISDFDERDCIEKVTSLANFIEQLRDIFDIESIDNEYRLFDDLKLSDIENRVGIIDIGRMGMSCPTQCLYCDTNFTVNYDWNESKRRDFEMDTSGESAGLESYLASTGLKVHGRTSRPTSPYMVELRARLEVGEPPQPVLVNVIGDGSSRPRAYMVS